MYCALLNICVFQKSNEVDSALFMQIRNTPLIRNFEYHIHCSDRLNQEVAAKEDILILADGAGEIPLPQIRSWCKEKAVLVLCADREELDTFTREELAQVDYIWAKGMTPAMTEFEYTRLLEDVRARKDAWLTTNCLDAVINSIDAMAWLKDRRGSHLRVNNSFCTAVGKTMEEVENRGHYFIWDITPEEYGQGEYVCLESDTETMERGLTCVFDENVKTKRGMRRFKTYKTPVFDEDGETILGTVGVANDVTDYMNVMTEMNLLLDSLSIGVLTCDRDWKIIHVNPAMKRLFPELKEEAMEKGHENYVKWKEEALLEIHESREQETWEAVSRQGEEEIAVAFQETLLKDVFEMPIGYLCLFRDMTLVRQYEQKISHYANIDALTGLSTRHRFFHQVEERGIPSAILFTDVDNFKGVNDRFGHQIGDLGLRIVADAIRETFPEGICARFGGDEFVIALYGDVTRDGMSLLAEKLQERVEAASLGKEDYHLSVSMGITCTTDSSLKIDELMRQSDMAMYAVKRHGKRGYVFFDPGMEALPADYKKK